MKGVLVSLLMIFSVMTYAVERPNSLWGQCQPTAHVDQKFTLQGIDIDLNGQGVILDVEGLDLVLKRGQTRVVLGHAEEFDLKACKNGGLSGFSEHYTLAQDVKVVRSETSVGICKPQLFGLPYTGYGVDWYRDIVAEFRVTSSDGTVSIRGKGVEWYRSLSECFSRK